MKLQETFYHGSKTETRLEKGILFMGPSKVESTYYAGPKGFVYEVRATKGSEYDYGHILLRDIVSGMMTFPEYDNDYPENWILEQLAPIKRLEGYRYLLFAHPYFCDDVDPDCEDDEYSVVISLYPLEDLQLKLIVKEGQAIK